MWRIAGTRYLSGTPKKASEEWPSEWFYIDDVALPNPIRMGLPEFSSALLKKCHSWRPQSLEEEIVQRSAYYWVRLRRLPSLDCQ